MAMDAVDLDRRDTDSLYFRVDLCAGQVLEWIENYLLSVQLPHESVSLAVPFLQLENFKPLSSLSVLWQVCIARSYVPLVATPTSILSSIHDRRRFPRASG